MSLQSSIGGRSNIQTLNDFSNILVKWEYDIVHFNIIFTVGNYASGDRI